MSSEVVPDWWSEWQDKARVWAGSCYQLEPMAKVGFDESRRGRRGQTWSCLFQGTIPPDAALLVGCEV